MSVSVVQSGTGSSVTSVPANGTITIKASAAFRRSITSGDLIVLFVTGDAPVATSTVTAPSVSDSQGNTYTQAAWADGGTFSPEVGIFYAVAVADTPCSVTFSCSAHNGDPLNPQPFNLCLAVVEISGATSPTTQGAGTSQQGTSTTAMSVAITDSDSTSVTTTFPTSAESSIAVADILTGAFDLFMAVSTVSAMAPTVTTPYGYELLASVTSLNGFPLFAFIPSGITATPPQAWLIIDEPGSTGLTDRSNYLRVGEGQHSFTLQLRQRGQATIELCVPGGDTYTPTRGTPFYLYDQTEDLTWYLVFQGLIQDIEQTWKGNNGDRYVTITGVSMESVFDTIYAPPIQYVDQTCGAIVTDLFNRFEVGCGVSLGTISAGPIVNLFVTNYEKLSDLFDQLAQTAQFTWGVTPDTANLYFTDPTLVSAPWSFNETELLWETADWKVNGQDYRNRQAVRLNYDAFPHSMEFFVGAGQTTFTLMRPVNQVTNAYATLSTPNTATGTFSGNPTAGDTVTIGPSSGTWQASHIYSLGGIIVVNGYVQRVSFAGTSGSSIPTFATIAGDTTTDGTVIWTCDGLAGLSNGTDTYTFVSSLDNTVFGEVLIGATASDTCQNLVDAINANAAVRGATISLPTWECSQCNAINKSGTSFTLQQKPAGTGYVAALSATGTAFSWSSTVTSGGTSPQGSLGPHEGATISLQVYEAGTSTAAPAVVYQKGSAVIQTATPLNVGSNLNVEYTRSDGNVIEVENTADVAAMAALTRGTGKYQQIADVSSTGLIQTSAPGGLQYAQEALAAYSVAPQAFTFETYKPGLRPGMNLTTALARPIGASSTLDGAWVIDEINAELVPTPDYVRGFGGHYRYTIRAVNVQEAAGYLDFWKGLGGGGSGGGGGAAGALVATSGGALRPDAVGDNFIDAETPSGSIDGSNTAFTLARTPAPASSLLLFRNGLLQLSSLDFSLSGKVVTFTTAPQTNDSLLAYYRY